MTIGRPIVSIVIINFNSGSYIFKCIKNIRAQNYPNLEIIVVDNASTDGSSSLLCADNDILYFRNELNRGSSAANNQGIENCNGQYVLVLNADVFISESYISDLVDFLESNKDVGTCIGKLISYASPKIIDSAGIEVYFEGVCHERGIGENDSDIWNVREQIAGACCAAALYRKEMLEEVAYKNEYFDELMFAFVEDSELAIRSSLFGWKTYYIPSATASHVRGGSTQTMSEFVRYLNLLNSEILYLKLLSVFWQHRVGYRLLWIFRNFKLDKTLKIKLRKELKELEPAIMKKREAVLETSRGKVNVYCPSFKSYLVGRIWKALQQLKNSP